MPSYCGAWTSCTLQVSPFCALSVALSSTRQPTNLSSNGPKGCAAALEGQLQVRLHESKPAQGSTLATRCGWLSIRGQGAHFEPAASHRTRGRQSSTSPEARMACATEALWTWKAYNPDTHTTAAIAPRSSPQSPGHKAQTMIPHKILRAFSTRTAC